MKTAIFLGAGASASEGAPLQSKLFSEYFKKVKKPRKEIKDFFAKMFDIDAKNLANLDKAIFPTFEEALGILDLADIRNESFKGFVNANVHEDGRLQLQQLRQYFSLLLATVIGKSVDSSKMHHSTLVDELHKLTGLSNVFFISTNYDTLIDNALIKALEFKDKIYLDYGIDFINFDEKDSKNSEDSGDRWVKPGNPSVNLYKIHGSLNWLYCPTCNNVRLTPKEKTGFIKLHDEHTKESKSKCRSCKTDYCPIIVPPTFYKDFTNVYLSIIWNKVEKDLLNTEHLIFCGYSFPDADMHIKYLIKRAQKNRKGRKLKISVVNNHPGKNEESKYEEEYRFKRYLGDKVNYTPYSFEDFAENPSKLIKVSKKAKKVTPPPQL